MTKTQKRYAELKAEIKQAEAQDFTAYEVLSLHILGALCGACTALLFTLF